MEKKITFVRVLRDCGFNKQLQASGSTRGLVYDFDVMADGVKIATFRKLTYKRGYELTDLSGQQVTAPWFGSDGVRRADDPKYRWRNVSAESKADFEAEVLKEFDYIPTAEQIEQRISDEKAQKRQEEAAAAERERIHRIEKAGPKLLEALMAARDFIAEEVSVIGDDHTVGICNCAERALLEKIDAAIAEAEQAPC